jgi:predicted RNase H-like HicB family nuclease
MVQRAFRVLVHREDGALWAEVPEVPGCFASGDTQEELHEALTEAISFCLDQQFSFERVEPATDVVEEHRLLLNA